jgi:hypothetical protein
MLAFNASCSCDPRQQLGYWVTLIPAVHKARWAQCPKGGRLHKGRIVVRVADVWGGSRSTSGPYTTRCPGCGEVCSWSETGDVLDVRFDVRLLPDGRCIIGALIDRPVRNDDLPDGVGLPSVVFIHECEGRAE